MKEKNSVFYDEREKAWPEVFLNLEAIFKQ
jgi:hypothetical protein